MTIQHLVLSGGGEIGVAFYGALRDSHKDGFWRIEDIRTIFSTSAGSLFGTVVCLTPWVHWDLLDDMLARRPWDQVFDINVDTMLNSIGNAGILGIRTVVDFLSPIMRAADVDPLTCTLAEFHEKTGIEAHYMATNLNAFALVDISYKTHPHWRVVDAVYASAALPGLFQPLVVEGITYVDGAFFSNFPLSPCVHRILQDNNNNNNYNPSSSNDDSSFSIEKDILPTIFCMRRICETPIEETKEKEEETKEERPQNTEMYFTQGQNTYGKNFMQYIMEIVVKLLYNVSTDRQLEWTPPYLLNFVLNYDNPIEDLYRTTSDNGFIMKLADLGATTWREFYNDVLSSSSSSSSLTAK